jgi:Zn-dependent protease
MLVSIFTLIILLFSIIIHEIAHGSVALYLGDPTAKYQGRLSINPLKHLDPIGSFIVPLFLFILTAGKGPIVGWAKPVPINPYNFKDQKWGRLKVSIAGPAANFLVAIFFGLIIRFFPLNSAFSSLLSIIVFYNFLWGLFNLVPIPPLDGSHILFSLLPERFSKIKFILNQYRIFLLVFFIIFYLNWLFDIAISLYTLVIG